MSASGSLHIAPRTRQCAEFPLLLECAHWTHGSVSPFSASVVELDAPRFSLGRSESSKCDSSTLKTSWCSEGLEDGGENGFVEINAPVLSGLRVVLKDAAFKHKLCQLFPCASSLAQPAGTTQSEASASNFLLRLVKCSAGLSFSELILEPAEQYSRSRRSIHLQTLTYASCGQDSSEDTRRV